FGDVGEVAVAFLIRNVNQFAHVVFVGNDHTAFMALFFKNVDFAVRQFAARISESQHHFPAQEDIGVSGEKDHVRLQQMMAPDLRPETYVYCTFQDHRLPADLSPICTFRSSSISGIKSVIFRAYFDAVIATMAGYYALIRARCWLFRIDDFLICGNFKPHGIP
ncbi:MAG: hypothetical protein B7Z26_01155, partial [Asticcacaulis sp. 32-58-5]